MFLPGLPPFGRLNIGPGASGGIPTPPVSIELDADTGAIPGGMTFSRSSAATVIDYRGILVDVASNVARFTYDPVLPYNLWSNPWGDGGVPGVSFPTSWSPFSSGLSGGTRTFVGSGVEDGIPYVDVLIAGSITVSAAGIWVIRGNNSGELAYSISADACLEANLRIVSGSTANLEVGMTINGTTTGGGYASMGAHGWHSVTTASLASQVYRHQQSSANAITAYWYPAVNIRVGGGVAGTYDVDLTLRIGFPRASLGAYITDSVPLPVLVSRLGTTPQYGLLGLFREETSANIITNPRVEGATLGVVGAGGVAPTDWFIPATGFFDIVRVAREAGIDYIDVRILSGAALAATFIEPMLWTLGAANTEFWTQSIYCRLIAGSLAGGVSIQHSMLFSVDGGATNTGLSNLAITPTSAPLVSQRTNQTRRATAGVNSSKACIQLSSTGACDFTLRIGLPVMEKVAFPSSPMRPTVAVPAAFTRAKETVTTAAVNLAKISIAGRLALSRYGSANDQLGYLFHAGSANGNDSARLVDQGSPARDLLAQIRTSNVARFSVSTSPDPAPDTFIGFAMGWEAGSGTVAFNGVPGTAVTPASTPAQTQPIILGGIPTGSISSFEIWKYLRVWEETVLSPFEMTRQSGRLT